MPNPSIKNEKMYRDLRKQGNSEEKSARISNAAAARGMSAVLPVSTSSQAALPPSGCLADQANWPGLFSWYFLGLGLLLFALRPLFFLLG